MATNPNDLTLAIGIAADAHDGQTDKASEPYILHPLRVMLAQRTIEARIAAVLHDVVEDCDVGLGDILALFGEDVRAAVDALTKRKGEEYGAYLDRVAANPIARDVKIADLRDNMDPARRPANDNNYDARMDKYRAALSSLTTGRRAA